MTVQWQQELPGWYGKLPGLGDFAGRRLPDGFVAAWDDWLQRGMAASQEALGASWLESFLTAPVWGFLLGARVLDGGPWAGILLPSVDRVGRYFPLTLAAAMPGLSLEPAVLASVQQWAERLEEAARAGLNPDAGVDVLEAGLQASPVPALPAGASAGLGTALLRGDAFAQLEAGGGAGLPDLAAGTGAQLADTLFGAYTLWWCRGPDGATGGFACQGMPGAAVFARMLQYLPGHS
ncbi:type VI secretion system-associated protein TagF [Azoarcus sp. TTM-91]|uniref:type VI secretion system-associated protein TagF n=1 Tax=Azoarcus sp. TTM-91 TaxID=2691581 RepID=UPI00145CADEB|nr:type VI secretion system-associated protein TagF [Azoarcus sp. TTM-91]NMG36015.1 type VI secretion system-associated protein TagF [Azoarcus sp. TTM-91]